ncbi:hypothetical protein G9A89_009670 [Geosiphon pyriformis]|nr:hypothetical protein G9A89_009670 [Geosiphon pyriformis]
MISALRFTYSRCSSSLLSSKHILSKPFLIPHLYTNVLPVKTAKLYSFLSSQTAQTTQTTPFKESDHLLIYTGPLSRVSKHLKFFSLSSLTATMLATPLIYMAESPIPMLPRWIFISLAIGTSALSTGLISFLFTPYVAKIYLRKPDSSIPIPSLPIKSESSSLSSTPKSTYPPQVLTNRTEITFETLSLFTRPHLTTIPISFLGSSARVFTTFKVKTQYIPYVVSVSKSSGKQVRSKLHFFVHRELSQHGEMKQLMQLV